MELDVTDDGQHFHVAVATCKTQIGGDDLSVNLDGNDVVGWLLSALSGLSLP